VLRQVGAATPRPGGGRGPSGAAEGRKAGRRAGRNAVERCARWQLRLVRAAGLPLGLSPAAAASADPAVCIPVTHAGNSLG
jgi:hypothetical protein